MINVGKTQGNRWDPTYENQNQQVEKSESASRKFRINELGNQNQSKHAVGKSDSGGRKFRIIEVGNSESITDNIQWWL